MSLAWWACAAFVLYTYAGYPALAAVLARLFPRPVARREWTPSVTVVVAAYNEGARVAAKLRGLCDQAYAGALEIVVASDGSTDDTDDVVRAFPDARVRLVRLAERSGKPTALNAALAAATGELVVLTDARQRLAPGSIAALVAALGDPAVGAVGGEYVMTGEGGAGAYWAYERWIRKQEARAGSTVGVSGALYATRRALWEPLPRETILDDVLVPMRLRLRGYRVAYEAGALALDDTPPLGREFQRKVRTLAGNFQLLALCPALLAPWAPSAFALWSHKLFRLFVPYALLAILAMSIWLPGPFYRAALLAQLACYAAAAAGAFVRGSRLVTLCHTFVALNAAAVVGLWRFLRARQRVTW